jgi:hypothetical protein
MKTFSHLSKFKLLSMTALFSVLACSQVSAKNLNSDSEATETKVSLVSSHSQAINVHTMFSNHRVAANAEGQALKPRRAPLALGQERQNSAPLSNEQENGQVLDHEFWVYDASTYLETDRDGDGFYRSFTVEFDVDVSAAYADVYAELYIRYPGGNWTHYYTTEVYEIEGDMTDTYQVTTDLSDGYIPDYYDLLIDVWEYGETEDILVATYSEADDNDLYQLPLEDSVEDRYYESNDDHHHAGSFSIPVLLGLMSLLAIRSRRQG